jgi:nitrogen-specific signal transduction histidine kinase
MDTPKATGRAQHDRSAPQIEMRVGGSLRPNPHNARTRTKREIRRIADSIQSAGNLQPIVVDENDVILAGHGRLAAEAGIPVDKLKSIFEPFITTRQNGMGLGLSIVRTIIETYGGKIWAENRLNGGAVFRFTLPLARQA